MVEGFKETFVLSVEGGDKGKQEVKVEMKEGWEEKWSGTESRAMDQVSRLAGAKIGLAAKGDDRPLTAHAS